MIIPDANLLIYAYDTSSPWQKSAATWLSGALSGDELFGLPWLVAIAFIRICTHPTINENPISPTEAFEIVASWERCACFTYIHPDQEHRRILQQLVEKSRISGNRINDAHLAALSLRHRATLYSTDNDFSRFPEVKWKNPIK